MAAITVICCPSCGDPCGKEYAATETDPSFREGVGENFVSNAGDWCCSQFCCDVVNGLYDEEDEEGN